MEEYYYEQKICIFITVTIFILSLAGCSGNQVADKASSSSEPSSVPSSATSSAYSSAPASSELENKIPKHIEEIFLMYKKIEVNTDLDFVLPNNNVTIEKNNCSFYVRAPQGGYSDTISFSMKLRCF